MRKPWVLAAAAMCCSLSCAELGSESEPKPGALYGAWRWVESSGGIGGDTMTPEREGYSRKIRLLVPETFESYQNEQLTKRIYFVFGKKTIGKRTYETIIYVDDELREQTYELPARDTLYLNDLCMDCFRHMFVRIQ